MGKNAPLPSARLLERSHPMDSSPEDPDSSEPLPARPVRGASLAVTLLIVALWGGNSVAVSFSVDTLPPVAVACVRFVMGTVVMCVWCVLQQIGLRPSRTELWWSCVAGFLLFAQISTFNVGVLWTNSTHGAMLINTFPFFVAGIEHWITHSDRLNAKRTVGFLVALAGVIAVMTDGEAASGDLVAFFWGDVVLLASALLLAIRVVYVGRVVQRMSPSKLILWHDIVGVALFAIWSLATESFSQATLTIPSLLGLLYQGVVIAGFCFVVHATLLKRHTASQISVFSFATPVFGVLFSILLRDEPLTLSVGIGAACVAFGIWAVTYFGTP